MGLFFGGEKVKVALNGVSCNLKLFSSIPIVNGIRLATSDDYLLQDSNGMYLTVKEDE